MSRRLQRPRLLLALVAAAALSVVAVVGLASVRGGEDAAAPPGPDTELLPGFVVGGTERGGGFRIGTELLPRIVLFGDTVRAVVHVTLDRERFDPESVRVTPQFSPWEVVGPPERERRDAGQLSHVRTTFVIRCMKSPCVPSGQAAPLELDSTRIAFSPAGAAEGERRRVRVEWPLLVVYSRFAAVRFEDAQTASTPWRVDTDSVPLVSFRAAPGLLVGVLLVVSILLACASVAIAYVAWPRRAPEPEPEPEPEPLPSLTPLEQALALLEESARDDGAGDQRRALELVAEELDEWGDLDLSGRARVLAWSEDIPSVEQTNVLAARVRAELERELLERAELEQNGAGHEA